jgi:hypothetical protein
MKANSSYAISRKVAQSSGIYHSLKANFTSRSDINLIVARGAVLQIYTLHEPLEDGIFPTGILAAMDEAKLLLVFETTLFNNIQAMAVVRLPGQSADSLILSFADAKVSVLAWEAEKNDVGIVSLHYFEKDAGVSGGVTQFVRDQQVLVDFNNRCACVLIYDEMLAVIPFVPSRSSSNQSNATAPDGVPIGDSDLNAQKKQAAASYLVHLPELGITNIKDIKFLHGYYEPTIMVLYEPTGTWAGRLAKTRNTVSIAIIELDISLRRKMLIWSMDKLPHDCYRICPLKNPGGAIVFSANAILFVDHSSKYRLSLNSYGDVAESDPDTVGKYVFEKSKNPISLDDAKFTFLSDTVALLSLETGALYFMTIITDGRSVTHIDLTAAGSSIVTTGMCTLNDRYFFVAARLANSLLLSYTPKIDQAAKRSKDNPSALDSNAFGEISDWCDPKDLDDDVVSVLANVKSHKANEAGELTQSLTKYDLRTVDTLISSAPMNDLLIRPRDDPSQLPPEPSNDPHYIPLEDPKGQFHRKFDPDADFDLLTACGYEKSGAICVLSKDMPHSVVDACEMANVMGAWALYALPDPPSLNLNENAMDVSDGSNHQKQANHDADDVLPARTKNAKRGPTSEMPAADADVTEAGNGESNDKDGEDVDGEEGGYGEYDEEPHHKVVLLTSPQQTHILVDGPHGMAPVSGDHGFLDKEETVGAGNVLAGHRIVQVGYYEIILLNSDLKRVQQLSFGSDSDGNDLYAVWCSILDPYVLIMTNEHKLILYEANQQNFQLEKSEMPQFDSHNAQAAKMATIYLFMDSNNMIGFNQLTEEGRQHQKETQSIISISLDSTLKQSSVVPALPAQEDNILTEEEIQEMAADTTELELYGNAKEFNSKRGDHKTLQEASKHHILSRAIHPAFLERPTFFAVAREDGQFEIWKLESKATQTGVSASLVFRTSNLHNGRQFMEHENEVKKPIGNAMDGEICLASVGSQHSLPFLIVKLDDGSVFAYTCHYFKNALVSDRFLPIRFVRVPLDIICHNLPLPEHAATTSERPELDENLSVITVLRRSLTHPTLTPFYSLAGRYSGVFIAGDSPLWLFCERDYLRPQHMSGLKEMAGNPDFAPSVTAFTPLNVPSCPYGFLYTASEKMNMATLNEQWDVEFSGGNLCALRVPLNESVHAISYDRENRYVIVTTSVRKREMLRYLRGAADDKREADLAKKIAEGIAQPLVYDMSTLDPRLPPIWEDVYYVKIVDPESWEVITQFECNPEEVAKARFMKLMNYVILPSTDPTPASVLGTTYAAKLQVGPYKPIPVLVVGTAIVRGEDAACKGRIVVLDVIEEERDENGQRKARIEMRTERMCLQPVTTLDVMDGHLLTAEGRSFYMYQLRVEEGLYRIGFLDGQLNTVSVTIVRNYILYGDIHHSVRLMRWLKAPHNWLQLVAKDPSNLDTVGTGAIIEGNKVTWLATDERGNIYMHAFTPSSNPEICPALEPVGDFHYGSRVPHLVRFRVARLPKEAPDALRNHGTLLGGQDGSLGYLLPVKEQIFAVLKKLESHLVSSLEHTAGLHPFSFRYPKPAYRLAHPHNRAVLDGDLLSRFLYLERSKQDELAKAIQVPSKFIVDLFATFAVQSRFL